MPVLQRRIPAGVGKSQLPRWSINAIELSRHPGMDRRTNRQDSRFARLCRPKGEGQGCPSCIQIAGMPQSPRHPWSLGSGDPCRNDEFFLNLMAVTLEHGNQNKINARGYGHDHSKLWAVR